MATRSAPAAPAASGPARRADVAGLLASEWTKLRSVRSTYWTLIVAAVLTVGFAALACHEVSVHWSTSVSAGFDPTGVSLAGIHIAQLAIGVLGVIVIGSEYSTGMIRTTLTAVPQRRLLLLAKAVVFGAVALVVGEVVSFAAFFIGQALLTSPAFNASIGQPGVLRAVVGAGVYLTTVGLLGLGIGAALRHTAGAITTLIAFLLVVPGLVSLLPESWGHDIRKVLPTPAGGQVTAVLHADPALFPALPSLLICIGWAVLAVAVGLVVISRRDA